MATLRPYTGYIRIEKIVDDIELEKLLIAASNTSRFNDERYVSHSNVTNNNN